MKNTRIYPLRTSSSLWKIKLYSKHICDEMCKYSYIHQYIENSSVMFIIDNPEYDNGKCKYSMKFNTSSIQISTYDKKNPSTIDGELLFYDNIVIPDTKIYIHLTFPFEKYKRIMITSDNPLGFSLNTILNKIKNIYKWIYQEEENTSSIKTFTIIDECNCKLNFPQNVYDSLKDSTDFNGKNCSICLEDESENNENNENKNENKKDIKITHCNHYFHKSCIYEWINNTKNTCPLCRKSIFSCSECKNGLIYKKYVGKVIPKNMRGILNRNLTDGIFGIYGYDLEDLFLEEMLYNHKTKVLYPKIFG